METDQEDIVILVHRKKKATTREELENFTKEVHLGKKFKGKFYIKENV